MKTTYIVTIVTKDKKSRTTLCFDFGRNKNLANEFCNQYNQTMNETATQTWAYVTMDIE